MRGWNTISRAWHKILPFLWSMALTLAGGTGLGCASGQPASPPDVLRMASVHINHAEGKDRRVDIKQVAKALRSINADIVALQGVDRGTARAGNVDQIVSLSEMLDMTYTFSRTALHSPGESGIAFLTRFPIVEERHVVADNVTGAAGFLLAVVERRGHEFVVINTDLSTRTTPFRLDRTLQQIERSVDRFSSVPQIICGFESEAFEFTPTHVASADNRWRQLSVTESSTGARSTGANDRVIMLADSASLARGDLIPLSVNISPPDIWRFRPIVVDLRTRIH